jgi:hypothetical protein
MMRAGLAAHSPASWSLRIREGALKLIARTGGSPPDAVRGEQCTTWAETDRVQFRVPTVWRVITRPGWTWQRIQSASDTAIADALIHLTAAIAAAADTLGWFRHCGYDLLAQPASTAL